MKWSIAVIDDLIGKPWEVNGNGNPGYDCFTLMRHLYALCGISIPPWSYTEENWKEVVKKDGRREAKKIFSRSHRPPQPGDIVIVGDDHFGMLITKSLVINCCEKRGVFSIPIKRIEEPLWRGRYHG